MNHLVDQPLDITTAVHQKPRKLRRLKQGDKLYLSVASKQYRSEHKQHLDYKFSQELKRMDLERALVAEQRKELIEQL